MAVIRLAFFNVWRRISRSIIALIAMAIAAAVLTSGLSLSQGLPPRAMENYREYFRGEILVFTPGFAGASPLQDTDNTMVRRSVIDSGFNLLLKYYPSLKTGYFAEENWDYRPFSSDDLKGFTQISGIKQVNKHYIIPASVDRQPVELKILPDKYWSPATGSAGFVPYDFDIVLNAYDAPKANVGDILNIDVPHFGIDQHGIPYADRSVGVTTFRARVVDTISIPTRSVTWTAEPEGIRTEQGYLHSPDIFLSEHAWTHLWQRQAAGRDYPVLSFSLTVENMADLLITTQELRKTYPSLAIFSIPEFIRHADSNNLLDKFYGAPPHTWQGQAQGASSLAQQDFGMVTAVLLFMNAGMLLASQMLASVAGRRNEIGILKAIGARQREVIGMILIEAAILALLGASVGFTLVRLAGIHQQLVNSSSILQVLKTTLQEQGLVLGMTMMASLLFGLLPAWRVSKLTVMEVFRNE